ncbi:MAG: hypothetical protein ACKVVP_19735 [Chloroflexota bacterium]
MRRRIARVGLVILSILWASGLMAGIGVLLVGIFDHGTSALASQSGAIALRDAMEHVRDLADDPTLQFRGELDQSLLGESTRPIYWLESGTGETTDEFRVDARTGLVLEAVFRSRMKQNAGDRRASIEDAAIIAARFGARHFDGFNSLTLLERSQTATGERDTFHTLKWVLVDSATQVELPVSVLITVSGMNGGVVRYLAQRDEVTVRLTPTVSKGQATITARNAVDSDARWRNASIESQRLQVIYDEVNNQRLAWAVLFARPRPSPTSQRLLVLVDAHTRDVIDADH